MPGPGHNQHLYASKTPPGDKRGERVFSMLSRPPLSPHKKGRYQPACAYLRCDAQLGLSHATVTDKAFLLLPLVALHDGLGVSMRRVNIPH